MYCIYYTELNVQVFNYAQKQRICREDCKYALDENFHGYFCPRRKAAKFCHPDKDCEAQKHKVQKKSILAHHVRKPWVWGDSDTGQKGTGDQAWVWLPAATMSWSNQKLLYPQQIPVCVSLI